MDPPKPSIPNDIKKNWQRIVNLIAKQTKTCACLIMKIQTEEIEVFLSSETTNNPYKKGDRENLKTGLYCETVIDTNKPLLVPEALKDPQWKNNPDIKLGMTYYFGYPLKWPDGEAFGTLCILDSKNNPNASLQSDLIFEFQQIIEKDLKIIYQENQVMEVNEMIRKNEQRHSLYVENTPLAVIEWNTDFRVIKWNPAAEEIFGYSVDEAIGQHAGLFVPDKYKAHVNQVWNDLLTQKGGKRSTNENVTKEGKAIFCEWYNTPLTTAGGETLGVTSLVLDITDRMLIEKALNDSEAKYRNLFENAVLGIYRTSPDGKILMTNKALLTMLGYSTFEELKDRNLDKEGFETQSERSVFKNKIDNKGKVSGMESTWLKANGEKIYVRESSIAIYDSDNKVQYYEGIVEDITQQRKDKEALLEKDRNYEDIIEKSKIGISIDDIDGNLTYCNMRYAELFGYTLEEIKSLPLSAFVHPEDLKRVEKIHNDRVKGKDVVSRYECRAVTKDSKVIHVEIDVIPIIENNKIVGTRSYVWDITERKKIEKDIQWKARIDKALAALYTPLISPSSNMMDIALMIKKQAQNLTESTQCYVGTIDLENGDLVSHTLTEMMENGQCAILQENNQRIAFPMGKNGKYGRLWGYSLNTKEAFYTNDVENHFASKGIPEGHIKIEKFLSLPVMLEQELVGQIALANPVRAYTDKDLIAIKSMADFFALAIQKLRFEEDLKKRTEELETFNKSMIDREMRIIELKEEINKQCEELNRPVRFPAVWDY